MVRLQVIAGLTILMSSTACIPIAADGAFRARGEIVGGSSACELQLFRGGATAEPIERVKVSGTFQETFVVAPYRGTYRLDLWCNGSVRQSLTVDYGGAVTYEKPVQFGKVAL